MANYTECPSCGTEVSKSAKKCAFCGARLKKPFYKKGGFIFLVLLCLLGGAGYLGKLYFELDYVQLAKQGGAWLHNVIVSELSSDDTPAPAPAEPAPEEETPAPPAEEAPADTELTEETPAEADPAAPAETA